MYKVRASLFCLALLLPGAAVAQSGLPNPSFNLVNRGGNALKQFFATPAGRPNWGGDRLNGAGLAPGAKAAIRLPADGNCIYDLRAVFADGRTEDKRGLNVCQATDVAVGESKASTATAKFFRLINRGSAPITSIAARAQGTDQWRTNTLRTGPIAPGSDRRIDLPPGGQCVFDLRVTFEGGTSREKPGADLCTAGPGGSGAVRRKPRDAGAVQAGAWAGLQPLATLRDARRLRARRPSSRRWRRPS